MADLWMPGATRSPQGGGVTLNTSLPPRATWHITWDAVTNGNQPPMENVSAYLERMAYCPHLMWDPFTGDLIQYYPADVGGRALNLWNEDGAVNIQIETYFSPGVTHNGKVYNTVAETPCKGLGKILSWLDSFGIPRVWPMGAPQWQGNPRDVDIWNTKAGHYGHCNVPGNTHTDPGPMPSIATIQPQGTTTEEDWFDNMDSEEKKRLLDAADKVNRYLSINSADMANKNWLYKNTAVNPRDVYGILDYAQRIGAENQRRINAANAKLTAMEEVLKQLAKGQGVEIDYDKIGEEIKAALADGIEITGSLTASEGTKDNG